MFCAISASSKKFGQNTTKNNERNYFIDPIQRLLDACQRPLSLRKNLVSDFTIFVPSPSNDTAEAWEQNKNQQAIDWFSTPFVSLRQNPIFSRASA